MSSVYKSLSGTKSNGTKHAASTADGAQVVRKNKQRVLILSSRGVTYRHRHLLNDIHALLPHSRKDAKLDSKHNLSALNELADLYNCNNILYFEARKKQDLYLWLAKPPNGPTVKFHLQNLHTMEELHFTGNCLRGSRPILSFGKEFDGEPYLRVVKELLVHSFGVPKGARKTKPFVDHVMAFTVAAGRVWVRCYQIDETEASKAADSSTGVGGSVLDTTGDGRSGKETNLSLVEIGPRFVMTPIVMLEGSFGGPVIYENKEFVSPNQVRSEVRKAKAGRHNVRTDQKRERRHKEGDLGLRSGEGVKKKRSALDERTLFAADEMEE
ncbi:hypothetical protein FH972_022310 [Carpinus fangiana]|uniref:Brix domain-containing protein n=1 Tax=Carpinus fangiana TaxID=176857 RepID=A0A5N6KS85_9ROSI|nr:hypothetical protein FH972_022310 [Carpinus fangiana]